MEQTDHQNGNTIELTEVENELYDRQIRLWGVESQKRLRNAKVLVSGMGGIGAEVTKNIILSGVNAVTLRDDRIVTEEDACSQFLTPRTALGENRAVASMKRAQALNPMVKIKADTGELAEKNEEYFKQFDVVVVCEANNLELVRVDEICRKLGVKFFAGDVWGMFGFCFADLQLHKFMEDVVKHKVISKPHEKIITEAVNTPVQRELNFPPYESIVDFDVTTILASKRKLRRNGPGVIILRILQIFRLAHNRDPCYKSRAADIIALSKLRNEITSAEVVSDEYFEHLFAQISPAAAIVGGVLAQEVIKVISQKEAPHCNLFIFDPLTSIGFIETIGVN